MFHHDFFVSHPVKRRNRRERLIADLDYAPSCPCTVVTVPGHALSCRGRARDRLIEVLEGFSEVDTGLTPVVTYGPNRRVGIEGAYMVAVDLERKTLVPRSGWIASR